MFFLVSFYRHNNRQKYFPYESLLSRCKWIEDESNHAKNILHINPDETILDYNKTI